MVTGQYFWVEFITRKSVAKKKKHEKQAYHPNLLGNPADSSIYMIRYLCIRYITHKSVVHDDSWLIPAWIHARDRSMLARLELVGGGRWFL